MVFFPIILNYFVRVRAIINDSNNSCYGYLVDAFVYFAVCVCVVCVRVYVAQI